MLRLSVRVQEEFRKEKGKEKDMQASPHKPPKKLSSPDQYSKREKKKKENEKPNRY
jgi:hypothetical protein